MSRTPSGQSWTVHNIGRRIMFGKAIPYVVANNSFRNSQSVTTAFYEDKGRFVKKFAGFDKTTYLVTPTDPNGVPLADSAVTNSQELTPSTLDAMCISYRYSDTGDIINFPSHQTYYAWYWDASEPIVGAFIAYQSRKFWGSEDSVLDVMVKKGVLYAIVGSSGYRSTYKYVGLSMYAVRVGSVGPYQEYNFDTPVMTFTVYNNYATITASGIEYPVDYTVSASTPNSMQPTLSCVKISPECDEVSMLLDQIVITDFVVGDTWVHNILDIVLPVSIDKDNGDPASAFVVVGAPVITEYPNERLINITKETVTRTGTVGLTGYQEFLSSQMIGSRLGYNAQTYMGHVTFMTPNNTDNNGYGEWFHFDDSFIPSAVYEYQNGVGWRTLTDGASFSSTSPTTGQVTVIDFKFEWSGFQPTTTDLGDYGLQMEATLWVKDRVLVDGEPPDGGDPTHYGNYSQAKFTVTYAGLSTVRQTAVWTVENDVDGVGFKIGYVYEQDRESPLYNQRMWLTYKNTTFADNATPPPTKSERVMTFTHDYPSPSKVSREGLGYQLSLTVPHVDHPARAEVEQIYADNIPIILTTEHYNSLGQCIPGVVLEHPDGDILIQRVGVAYNHLPMASTNFKYEIVQRCNFDNGGLGYSPDTYYWGWGGTKVIPWMYSPINYITHSSYVSVADSAMYPESQFGAYLIASETSTISDADIVIPSYSTYTSVKCARVDYTEVIQKYLIDNGVVRLYAEGTDETHVGYTPTFEKLPGYSTYYSTFGTAIPLADIPAGTITDRYSHLPTWNRPGQAFKYEILPGIFIYSTHSNWIYPGSYPSLKRNEIWLEDADHNKLHDIDIIDEKTSGPIDINSIEDVDNCVIMGLSHIY